MNQLYILYLASLLTDLSVGGTIFAVTRRAAELGAGAGTLGLLGAAWILPYAVLAFIAGRVSDRLGRRRVALVCPVMNSVVIVACAFTTRVPVLVALTVAFGFGLGRFWPAVIAWIGDGVAGAALHRRLTWFGVSWNIGLIIGFGLAGALFQHWPRAAFYVSAAATITVGLLLLLPARMPAGPTTTEPIPAVPAGRGFRKTAWLANFAVQLATGGVTAIFPQLATHLGIKADVHGGLLALARAAALVIVIGLQLATFWRTRLWPLWAAQAVGIAAIAVVAVGNATWVFAAAFLVMGALTGYSYQASIFFTLDEMAEKGKGGGLHEAILALGMFLGPLLAGWVGNTGSLRAPYWFCAVMLAALVAAQIAVVVWRRKCVTMPT